MVITDGGAKYNLDMSKRIIHLPKKEVSSTNVADLQAYLRTGAKIVIEKEKRPMAILHVAEMRRNAIAECIALARGHEEETGKTPVSDSDFAEDLQEIRSHRNLWGAQ